MKLYDAARCPYRARVRPALEEKGIAYEPVETWLDAIVQQPAFAAELETVRGL